MASIIEELIMTLEAEDEIYKQIIPIAQEKTKIIIKNDLKALQDVTAREQNMVDKILVLEKKRQEVVTNMSIVLNIKEEELNVKKVIEILKNQPKEQKQLSIVHDSLKKTLNRVSQINNHNRSLIEKSLEMIEFNMNLIQSTRMSPGSGSYTKNAYESDASVWQTGMFDARQ